MAKSDWNFLLAACGVIASLAVAALSVQTWHVWPQGGASQVSTLSHLSGARDEFVTLGLAIIALVACVYAITSDIVDHRPSLACIASGLGILSVGWEGYSYPSDPIGFITWWSPPFPRVDMPVYELMTLGMCLAVIGSLLLGLHWSAQRHLGPTRVRIKGRGSSFDHERGW